MAYQRLHDGNRFSDEEYFLQKLHTLSKKKGFTGSVKPMSAHEEKTLDTAVALANEITSKSMNDLDNDKAPLTSPCERYKFPFKFPLVSSLHHVTHHDAEKETSDKAERRNFSKEAQSVPDIQATITKECKQAYESLIEKPLPTSSLISQISQDMPNTASKVESKMSTIPKPAPRQNSGQFHSLQKQIPYKTRSPTAELSDARSNENPIILNVLPLPPRGNKPMLVDKPRHIRKYPLKIPNETAGPERAPIVIVTPPQEKPPAVLYQNTVSCAIPMKKIPIKRQVPTNRGTDVFDGPVKAHTNPFTTEPSSGPSKENDPGPSSVNPFQYFLKDDPLEHMLSDDGNEEEKKVERDFEKLSLTKDHVSVEDLLEFADKKPSSRQRGAESDEVRIMSKVLKQQVTPMECLQALEFSDWNVHMAIKLLRVKIAVGDAATVTFEDCRRELETADGDIVKASSVLVLNNKNNKEYMLVSFRIVYLFNIGCHEST